MQDVSFFVWPVRLYEQRKGVLAQAVLHVVVEVGLLHAGEGALEAFVVVGLPPWSGNIVRLLRLALLVFAGRCHFTGVVLGHD